MKSRALLAVLLLVVALTEVSAQTKPRSFPTPTPAVAGYYVVAHVLSAEPDAAGAPIFTVSLRHIGPFSDKGSASARLDEVPAKGIRDGDELWPPHTVQKAWIYYRCAGCEIE
jgi:hypothetical protein